jgi:hypothetical protein
VRVELSRPATSADGEPEVLGSATFEGSEVSLEPATEEARPLLERIFRRTPVSIEDPSLLGPAARGPVVLQPGSLRWFRAAAEARGAAEGLASRFVPDGTEAMGWDPAGAYRPFVDAVERKDRLG